MKNFAALLFAVIFTALPAVAQQPPSPVGVWRCVVNSPVVSIDLQMQAAANGQLAGRGTIVYVSTGRIYNVQGPGDWSALPPGTEAPNWLFKFRMAPQNHAIFSWFAAPTETPGILYNVFQDPNTGSVVETSCQQLG